MNLDSKIQEAAQLAYEQDRLMAVDPVTGIIYDWEDNACPFGAIKVNAEGEMKE